MPITTQLSGMFGKSPIKPMQEHMAESHKAAGLLDDFFLSVKANNWKQAAEIQRRIGEAENKADALKKEIRLTLPKSIFLPVSRSDLLELLSVQDKIANRAKDIAGIMLGREMSIPEVLEEKMLAYVATAVATSAQALKAIEELDELLETGFAGREALLVQKMIEELDRLEHRNDELQIAIRGDLFKIEKDLPPVDVMFFYRVIEWVGDLADRAQKVGSRLQLLLAR
jgi:predicted phosphate transport protein (TIGR00153 family)